MTQCEVILGVLRIGRSITTMQAFDLYEITTLSQRIGDIKRTMLKKGEVIVSIRNDGDRHHTYFLRRKSDV